MTPKYFGRPKLLTSRAKQFIVQKNQENSQLSVPKINDRLRMVTHTEVCDQNVLNVLMEHNINNRLARKKLLISEANMLKQFSFALSNKNKTLDFWKTVV